MSLTSELDAFCAEFAARIPPKIRKVMTRVDMELAASVFYARTESLRQSARLPVAGCARQYVRLNDMLAKGPVVLSFYQGGWC